MWRIICAAIGIHLAVTFGDKTPHMRFWQISDVHYDPQYSQHGDPATMCHLHDNKTGTPGYYGNYSCDASWNLVLSAMEELKKTESQPFFILWTGDSVPHVEQKNVESVYDIISNVSGVIPFPGNPPIIPVLGNHDAFPSNQMPLVGKDSGYYQNILTRGGWSAFLTEQEQTQFLKGGYYVKSFGDPYRLKIVVLNSNLWYSMNKLTAAQTDPNQQFSWLRQQLVEARTKKVKVYIVAHICPGGFERLPSITWFYPQFNKRYVELIQEFSTTILAHFCGHEHTDSFRLVFDKNGSPASVMFLSPAVTPWRSTLPEVGANNPSVRLYQALITGEIIDYYQYYMNLPQANSQHTANHSTWQMEYRATEVYSIPDCSATSYNNLITNFTKSSSLFRRYLQYNTVSYDLSPSCDQTCFMAQTCAILNIDLDKFSECLSWSGTTPQPSPDSSTKHHHKPHPLPRYVYYIIGGMAFIIVLLAVVVSCLCARQRRRHGIPFKYGRFVNPIN